MHASTEGKSDYRVTGSGAVSVNFRTRREIQKQLNWCFCPAARCYTTTGTCKGRKKI